MGRRGGGVRIACPLIVLLGSVACSGDGREVRDEASVALERARGHACRGLEEIARGAAAQLLREGGAFGHYSRAGDHFARAAKYYGTRDEAAAETLSSLQQMALSGTFSKRPPHDQLAEAIDTVSDKKVLAEFGRCPDTDFSHAEHVLRIVDNDFGTTTPSRAPRKPPPDRSAVEPAIFETVESFFSYYNAGDWIYASGFISSNLEAQCGGATAVANALRQMAEVERLEYQLNDVTVTGGTGARVEADVTFSSRDSLTGEAVDRNQTVGLVFSREARPSAEAGYVLEDFLPIAAETYC